MRKSILRQHLIIVHAVDRSELDTYGAAGKIECRIRIYHSIIMYLVVTLFFIFTAKDVRPVLPFKCEQCERTYKSKNTLKQHLTYECGLNPSFSCTQCDYKAKRKSSINSHLRSVHGEDHFQLE